WCGRCLRTCARAPSDVGFRASRTTTKRGAAPQQVSASVPRTVARRRSAPRSPIPVQLVAHPLLGAGQQRLQGGLVFSLGDAELALQRTVVEPRLASLGDFENV